VVSSEAVDRVEYMAAVHGAAVGHPAPHGRADRRRPLDPQPQRQRALLPWLVAGPSAPGGRGGGGAVALLPEQVKNPAVGTGRVAGAGAAPGAAA